jgi:hypothetical protein
MVNGKPPTLGLELTQASLGLFERCGGAVSLRFDPAQLFAQVAILLGSLRRFVFPLIAALSDFGQLAHQALSGQDPPLRAAGAHSVR